MRKRFCVIAEKRDRDEFAMRREIVMSLLRREIVLLQFWSLKRDSGNWILRKALLCVIFLIKTQ
jgi:hypothetical protein